MNSIDSISLYSFCICKGLANDELIGALKEITFATQPECACAAYCSLVGKLCEQGESLSEYLYRRTLYDDNAFMRACATTSPPSPMLRCAMEHDVAALSHIAAMTAPVLKAAMAARFPEYGEQLAALPDFESGTWEHTADEFAAFAAANGFGVFARNRAFVFDCRRGLRAVEHYDRTRLADLKGYVAQRGRIVDNTRCFVEGKTANNVLLYGDRGTGKSSTVKALLNEFGDSGLRMVQIGKESLCELGTLIEQIGDVPLRFILFIDDLTFNENDDSFGALKAVLEGSLIPRPANMLIYATTNRRHLIKETFTAREGDEIHKADTIDENLSLSDRFGLLVTFTMPTKDGFLDIVCALARDRGLAVDEEQLRAGAERFALTKSGRTPRLAKQYIDYAAPRVERGLPL